MTVGAAAILKIVGATFRFVSDLFFTVAEFAESLGNPELSFFCAAVVIGLVASGRYTSATFALLSLSLLDLVFKELGLNISGAVF